MLLIAGLLLSACVVLPSASEPLPPIARTEVSATASLNERAIPVETLKSATYSGIYDGPITLEEGVFEGAPFVKNEPARPMVQYINSAELQGDLDGDGVDDAVVFLLDRGGGTGAFTWVAAQLNRAGKPVDAGAVMIEDRIGVRSATIENGQVVLDIITQGPGDVACCGTHKAHKVYALQAGRLAEIASDQKELAKVSAADLNGTHWTLLEINEGKPTLADTKVTASFKDGKISGSGGCNSYTTGFSLGKDNPFAMTTSPVAATQKACPEPALSQETAFFTALQDVSHWGYVFGRLALYYGDGQGKLGRLLFAPQ
jgi:heat shock protein HslJ